MDLKDIILIEIKDRYMTLGSFFDCDGNVVYEYYNTIDVCEKKSGEEYMELLGDVPMYRDEKVDIGHLHELSKFIKNSKELMPVKSYDDAIEYAIKIADKTGREYFAFKLV